MSEKYSELLNIVRFCRLIDLKAIDIYRNMSLTAETAELSRFWLEMADDETAHVLFWEQLITLAHDGTLPPLFDDPYEMLQKLISVFDKVSSIIDSSRGRLSVIDQFLLAFRLEFYLVTPSFEALFRFMKSVSHDFSELDNYESHLNKFITMLQRHGVVSEELDLLGETLVMLWRENRRLSALSTLDPLTGILNKRGFIEAIGPLVHYSKRKGIGIGVLMIDIDDFKSVNKVHGHQKGDEVLRKIGLLLGTNTRDSDVVARFGGEEFIVLLMDYTRETAEVMAEKIRALVENETKPSGIPVTVSIGVGGGLFDDHDISPVISLADRCLFKAKAAGKNRVICDMAGTA